METKRKATDCVMEVQKLCRSAHDGSQYSFVWGYLLVLARDIESDTNIVFPKSPHIQVKNSLLATDAIEKTCCSQQQVPGISSDHLASSCIHLSIVRNKLKRVYSSELVTDTKVSNGPQCGRAPFPFSQSCH